MNFTMDNPQNINPDGFRNNYPQPSVPNVYPPSTSTWGNVPDYGHQPQPAPLDPDNPPWGVFAGLGVWFASGALLFIVQIIAVVLWMIFSSKLQAAATNSQEVMKDPQLLFFAVASTLPAHLLTIALCWAVATGFGKRSFKESIGWEWKGFSPHSKFFLVISVVVLAFLAEIAFTKIIPTTEKTPFSEMLKTNSIRYLVAAMAVITAPATEEFVYRGMLFSPLTRAIGPVAAVTTTAVLFAVVHVPQYWGAWGSIAGLLFLSIALTIVRARTRSILPCILIHTVFNLIGAIGIITLGGKAQ